MESKEIFAVILAVAGIVLVIGILSMVTKKDKASEQTSQPEITEVTQQQPVYLETDIWDVLREQNTTTDVTEVTLPDGSVSTDLPEGTAIEGTDLSGDVSAPESTDSALPEGAITETVPGSETVTETTAEAGIVALPEEPMQTYILQLP